MYLQFFGLTEPPFSITPDPAFVYLSAVHREALAHLLYGVGQGAAGGFVQLTGEVGTGKTTLCRCLLEQLPEGTQVALILNPLVTPRELLSTICDELGVRVGGSDESNKVLVDALNAFLLEQHATGHRVVVIIDEAQNLSPEALEQVRLLTNLETAKHKLLQMVLLGQPELRQLLQRRNLRQLAQRITARYHLTPLARDETVAYVRHRLQVAGAQRNPFGRAALKVLHRRSGGVPRLINIIADRALAGAYARESTRVGVRLVHAAADEVQPSERRVQRHLRPAWWLAASAVVLLGIAVVYRGWAPGPDAVAGPEVAPSGTPPSGTAVVTIDDTTAAGPFGDVAPETPAAGLGADWLDRQHDRAFAALAELWQDAGNAEAIRSACSGAAATGYACLRESGNWSRLAKLGLPVILILNHRGGRNVLLRGLSAERVLLGAGEGARVVPREEVDPVWLGDYLVAWPQAPDWPAQIRRGERGTAVDIVLQMAALADPDREPGGAFDRRFETWLMEFQQRHGLTADGIIGPRTLLYLMAPGITEPRLLTSVDERS